jgi:hypothetical protein
MKPSHTVCASVEHWRTDRGLHAEKGKGLRQVFVESFGRQRPVLIPPHSRSVDLPLSSPCELYYHCVLAVSSGKLRKHLFGGDHFPAVGLSYGEKQLGFLFGG